MRIYDFVRLILNELVVNKLDDKTPEGEDFINNFIDEFITNFYVHYN